MTQAVLRRSDASMPYQDWRPFPPEAIVKVWSYYEDVPPVIEQSKNLWWGYQEECGEVSEGVIARARRLDKPRTHDPKEATTDGS